MNQLVQACIAARNAKEQFRNRITQEFPVGSAVQWSAEAMLQSMIAYVKGEIER